MKAIVILLYVLNALTFFAQESSTPDNTIVDGKALEDSEKDFFRFSPKQTVQWLNALEPLREIQVKLGKSDVLSLYETFVTKKAVLNSMAERVALIEYDGVTPLNDTKSTLLFKEARDVSFGLLSIGEIIHVKTFIDCMESYRQLVSSDSLNEQKQQEWKEMLQLTLKKNTKLVYRSRFQQFYNEGIMNIERHGLTKKCEILVEILRTIHEEFFTLLELERTEKLKAFDHKYSTSLEKIAHMSIEELQLLNKELKNMKKASVIERTEWILRLSAPSDSVKHQ